MGGKLKQIPGYDLYCRKTPFKNLKRSKILTRKAGVFIQYVNKTRAKREVLIDEADPSKPAVLKKIDGEILLYYYKRKE
jgi:hypothetical protein